MAVFPVPSGQFAGMSEAGLLTLRSQAQQALFALEQGLRPQSLSYSQGDGSRSITYTPTSADKVRMFIMSINRALGQGGRRPIEIVFG